MEKWQIKFRSPTGIHLCDRLKHSTEVSSKVIILRELLLLSAFAAGVTHTLTQFVWSILHRAAWKGYENLELFRIFKSYNVAILVCT